MKKSKNILVTILSVLVAAAGAAAAIAALCKKLPKGLFKKSTLAPEEAYTDITHLSSLSDKEEDLQKPEEGPAEI